MRNRDRYWWPLTQASVLLSPVLLLLGLAVAGVSTEYIDRYWLDLASTSTTSIMLVAPAFAALSAWDASRWRLLSAVSARSALGLLVRHLVWVAAAMTLIFAASFTLLIGLVGVPAGKPTVAVIAMTVLATTGYAAFGFGLGWFVPGLIAAPSAFALVWLWVAYTPAVMPFWLRNVTGNVGSSCCSLNQELLPAGLWAPVIATGALTIAVMIVLAAWDSPAAAWATATQAGEAWRTGAPIAASVLALLVASGGLVTARALVLDVGPDPVRDRTSKQICISENGQTLCAWPQNRAALEASAPELTQVAENLRTAGLDVPMRMEESRNNAGWSFYTDTVVTEDTIRSFATSLIIDAYPACLEHENAVRTSSYENEVLALAWLEVAAGIEIESAIDYNQVASDDLTAILALPQAEQLDWFAGLHRELNSCEYVE